MPQTALYFTMLQISAIPNCLSQLKDANCIKNFIVAEISVLLSTQIKDTGERIKFYDMTAWDMTLWSLHLSVAPFTCMAIHARIPRVWNCISCLKSWIVVECWNFRSSSNPDCNLYLYINHYNINHLHTHLPFPRHITATVNTSKNIHLWAIASFTTFLTIRCCQSFNNQPKSELRWPFCYNYCCNIQLYQWDAWKVV